MITVSFSVLFLFTVDSAYCPVVDYSGILKVSPVQNIHSPFKILAKSRD